SLLVQTARTTPVLIVTAGEPEQGRAHELRRLGCEVLGLPAERGRPSVPALLDELGRRRLTNLLVEGGSEVLGSFLEAGAIEEVHVFVAPRLAGGAAAKTPVGGIGVARIAESLTLAGWHVENLDGDVVLHGWK